MHPLAPRPPQHILSRIIVVKVSDQGVVWNGHDGSDWAIFLAKIIGHTQIGSDVTVEPGPGVIIEFSEVIEPGTTRVTTSSVTIVGGPTGFWLKGHVFEITTDASYTPPILVTVPYDDTGMNLAQERNLFLMHAEGDPPEYVNITVSVDTTNNTITGETNSLSPFVVAEEAVSASINIDPGTLNKKSKGGDVTAYLKLPTEYSVADIELISVSLYGRTYGLEKHVQVARTSPIELGDDGNGDGKPDYLMVKFDRYEVQEIVGEPGDVELGITFSLLDGTSCAGGDTIKVIDKGKAHFDSRDPASVEY